MLVKDNQGTKIVLVYEKVIKAKIKSRTVWLLYQLNCIEFAHYSTNYP